MKYSGVSPIYLGIFKYALTNTSNALTIYLA
jgi:hypothetical protein